MRTVSIYGQGQLGRGIATVLQSRGKHRVLGPFSRDSRQEALASGADVVVIATTTRLRDVWDDIRLAVESGSNVLVSAEESANPWLVDTQLADDLDGEARTAGVTILGAGLNPGLIFDALVLTLLGAAPDDVTIEVRRVVDISGFGATILGRLGIGYSVDEFYERVSEGHILGHAGFPQSMSVVGRATGRQVFNIESDMAPIVGEDPITLASGKTIPIGYSSGVDQTYRAIFEGACWYTAKFLGHVSPESAGLLAQDSITLFRGDEKFQEVKITPAFDPQIGSRQMLANSIDRVLDAHPGWVTVADLRPASMSRNLVL